MDSTLSLPHDHFQRRGGVSNETFGMVLFLVVETMFFAGLVSSYIVLRTGAREWRPIDVAPLARGLSVSMTALLTLSAVSTFLAQRRARHRDTAGLKAYLLVTLLIGATFVGLQVYEFWRLSHQVPFAGSLFGNVFYTLSGLHGIHVLGGVLGLVRVLWRAARRHYERARPVGVDLFAYYWYFVVAVWLFLFFALYVL